MPTPHYIVITPARNEQENIAQTIRSVVAQTIRPDVWVIVDDGSSDQTGAIVDAAAKEHTWIRVIHRPDRGARKTGGGVIEAFTDGYRLVAGQSWDFIVKLDADLVFAADYFERCFGQFAVNARLGIAGGAVWSQQDGQWINDGASDPGFHVRGATKIYRRACWEAIGGLVPVTGWDTLDELKANMLGWRSYSLPELKLQQLRYTGAADGTWGNWFKNGLANYMVGYHPLFMLTKCARRLFRAPVGIGAAGLLCGFISGYVRHVPQINDDALIRYLRHQQTLRLLLQKSIYT